MSNNPVNWDAPAQARASEAQREADEAADRYNAIEARFQALEDAYQRIPPKLIEDQAVKEAVELALAEVLWAKAEREIDARNRPPTPGEPQELD